MRRSHLESLKPVCPVCRDAATQHPIALATVLREEEGHVVEGVLQCRNPRCQREYPIVDGIPILIKDIRRVVTDGQLSFIGRDDLSPEIEGVLGDCLGPGTAFDSLRLHKSTYCAGHWSDLDPDDGRPAAVSALVRAGYELTGPLESPVIDLGCAVGRGTFAAAARTDGLVLGVDLHFSLLRVAARTLRTGRVRYDRRRVGLVYDRREFAVELPGAERVDFWMADALALPFAQGTFGGAMALNVLDCLAVPHMLPGALAAVLRLGARAVLCSPYDWSPAATPMEGWIGGHSQRGPERGRSEASVRALLTPGSARYMGGGLRISGEVDVEWDVLLHDRAEMRYRVDMLGLVREDEP